METLISLNRVDLLGLNLQLSPLILGEKKVLLSSLIQMLSIYRYRVLYSLLPKQY